jgi:hypothetical protein
MDKNKEPSSFWFKKGSGLALPFGIIGGVPYNRPLDKDECGHAPPMDCDRPGKSYVVSLHKLERRNVDEPRTPGIVPASAVIIPTIT